MADDSVKVHVEIPKGSRNKYERNPETGELELDRRLFASVSYPTEYGYIEGTRSDDGDELDALIAITEPTFPGCVVNARPVGVLQMDSPSGEANPKILCVPLGDPSWDGIREAEDMPAELREEIAHFFKVYSTLGGEQAHVHGWGTRQEAETVIRQARDRARSLN